MAGGENYRRALCHFTNYSDVAFSAWKAPWQHPHPAPTTGQDCSEISETSCLKRVQLWAKWRQTYTAQLLGGRPKIYVLLFNLYNNNPNKIGSRILLSPVRIHHSEPEHSASSSTQQLRVQTQISGCLPPHDTVPSPPPQSPSGGILPVTLQPLKPGIYLVRYKQFSTHGPSHLQFPPVKILPSSKPFVQSLPTPLTSHLPAVWSLCPRNSPCSVLGSYSTYHHFLCFTKALCILVLPELSIFSRREKRKGTYCSLTLS